MKLINATCTYDETIFCSDMIMAKHPTAIGISHVAGKHLVIFPSDDNHELNKEILHQIGGMSRKINKVERQRTRHTLPIIEELA
mgnify:CR=1 FL=1